MILRIGSHTATDIEKELGVAQPPLHREHPSSTLFEAAKLLIQTHARRLPLLDNDSETGHEVIVSVLTQYRLLKFISINVRLPFSFHCIIAKLLPTVYKRDPTTQPYPAAAAHRDLCLPNSRP